VLWLEQHLHQYKGTVICITHDRYFLDNVAGWILELESGKGHPFKGNYSSWLEQKSERLRQDEKTESKRAKVLERELDWVRQGAKGRQAKSKARLKNYEQMLESDAKQKDEQLEFTYQLKEGISNDRIGYVILKREKVVDMLSKL
jgi:ATPase subunit of ABC transporter with duplicated ATPase domains